MTDQMIADVKALRAVRTQKSARIVLKRARYDRVNTRRAELIERSARNRTTVEEEAELAVLQRVTGVLISRAYPFPRPSKKVRELLARLDPDGGTAEEAAKKGAG